MVSCNISDMNTTQRYKDLLYPYALNIINIKQCMLKHFCIVILLMFGLLPVSTALFTDSLSNLFDCDLSLNVATQHMSVAKPSFWWMQSSNHSKKNNKEFCQKLRPVSSKLLFPSAAYFPHKFMVVKSRSPIVDFPHFLVLYNILYCLVSVHSIPRQPLESAPHTVTQPPFKA